jgi:hypothetical protein
MAQTRAVMIQLPGLASGEIVKPRKTGWKVTALNRAADPQAEHIGIGEGHDCRSNRAFRLEKNSHGDREKAPTPAKKAAVTIAAVKVALPKPIRSQRLSAGLAASSCSSLERGFMGTAHMLHGGTFVQPISIP